MPCGRRPFVHRPGGMADGQHDRVGGDLVATCDARRKHSPVTRAQPCDCGFEPVFDAQAHQVRAQRREHARQAVRSDVRARLRLDIDGRAEAHQIGDDVGDRGAILGARVELAVGERPRPALAKTVVRARRQLAARQQRQIAAARLHGLALFDDGDRNVRFRQSQRCPRSSGAGADDDHARRGSPRRPECVRRPRRAPRHGVG